MNWYYVAGSDRKGPVEDDGFQQLVQQGIITPQTLIWREGMADWQPYGSHSSSPASLAAQPGSVTCANCGGMFPATEVIELAGQHYCATCKPLAVQRLKEGVVVATGAEEIRKEHIKHEASVRSIGVLYYLGGIALLAMAAGQIAMGAAATRPLGAVTGVVFGALSIAQFVVGTGLRRLRSWARVPTGILSGMGLLAFPLGTIINAYILYLVFSRKGKMVFSDEYHVVMEQTPHIKYRTSIVVWIFVVLVLALVLFASFATNFRHG